MICKPCAYSDHETCDNGSWANGTKCDCQHRFVALDYMLSDVEKQEVQDTDGGPKISGGTSAHAEDFFV